MADEPRRGVTDRELIEAWFEGSGATVVTVFMSIAALAVIFVVAGDSPVLAIVLVAALGTAIYRMRGKD